MEATAAPWAKNKVGGSTSSSVNPAGVSAVLPSYATAAQQEHALGHDTVDQAPERTPKGFFRPRRRVKNVMQVATFQRGPQKRLLEFLGGLNEAIKSRPLSDDVPASENVVRLVDVLNELHDWIDEIPPVEQPMRYGNVAFRSWAKRLEERAEALVQRFLPDDLREASVEVVPFFLASFGNERRLDYGTGHETTFFVLLLTLTRMGVFKPTDSASLILKVFAAYMRLVRRIQLTYWLEPAGSRGVWSLDDYQFLVFYFGAGQLVDQTAIRPRDVQAESLREKYGPEYLYFDAIRFIMKVKVGAPFSEHSPDLFSVSQNVPNWEKVNSGMLKMYQDQVLSKFPVLQHMLFGSQFPFDEQEEARQMSEHQQHAK